MQRVTVIQPRTSDGTVMFESVWCVRDNRGIVVVVENCSNTLTWWCGRAAWHGRSGWGVIQPQEEVYHKSR